jgi:hypothetical protein
MYKVEEKGLTARASHCTAGVPICALDIDAQTTTKKSIDYLPSMLTSDVVLPQYGWDCHMRMRHWCPYQKKKQEHRLLTIDTHE